MKGKRVSKSSVAAYNHGYAYCMTYCTQKAIDIFKLQEEAAYFYASVQRQNDFVAGYDHALHLVNCGTFKPCTLA